MQTRGKMETEADEIFSKLPDKLVKKLMPFQKDGVKFAVHKNGRCLIADEMGLGKTLQAISVACYYKSEWPLLIIVPSSLRYSWIEEFEKWLPDINPGEINLIQSGVDASGIENSLVTITTFGLLSNAKSTLVKEALVKQAFKVVIVDESHYIKNVKTVTAKTVVPIIKNANRRILLSGTPALARPVELFPQIDAVCPNMFGSWWSYTNRYCDAKLEWFGRVKRRNVNGASNLEELQQKLSSLLMIRREKNDVLTQLPPKQRQRILFDLKDSDLKKEIRKTFEDLRSKLKQKAPEEEYEVLTGGGEHDTKDFTLLQLIQQLYQLSGDAKIGPAKEYVEMLCDNPKLKFLVFAYHHNMMNGLTQSLYDKQIKFIRIDGTTPPSDRPILVNQFQSDPDTRVAVLSILAAGVGLTLTAATVVVFAEMYWTPGVMIQCEDRAHRIGQASHVAVHYLIAKDTMDEWVWSAVCKKTIVTSATLLGKKRKMEADEGDQYQIDVLSKAEAWVPKNKEDLDLTNYFNTQLNPDQKSIKDFFSPSQGVQKTWLDRALMERKEKRKASPLKTRLDTVSSDENETNSSQPYKKQKFSADKSISGSLQEKSKLLHDLSNKNEEMTFTLCNQNVGSTPYSKKSEESCLIVLDSDDDFTDKPSSLRKSSKKKSVQKSKTKSSKVVKKSPSTPKCNLLTIFSQSSNESPTGSVRKHSKHQNCFTGMHNPDNHKNEVGPGKQIAECTKGKNAGKSSYQWSCSSCTFLNHNELTYCEMCETPKKMKHYSYKKEEQSDLSFNALPVDNNDIQSVNSNYMIRDEADCRSVSNKSKYSFRVGSEDNKSGIQDSTNIMNEGPSPEPADQDSNNEFENSLVSGDDSVESDKNLKDTLETCQQEIKKTEKTSSAKVYKFKHVKRDGRFKTEENGYLETILSDSPNKENNLHCVGNKKEFEENVKHTSLEPSFLDFEKQSVCQPDSSPIVGIEDTGTFEDIPVYSMFKYQCSKYTGRIYLLTVDNTPLNVNFIPIDVEVCNYNVLPDILHHPNNLKLVQKFVREWQNLTETKKRLVIKAGRSFVSPLREYEELQSCKTQNAQRHKTKSDTANAALAKAAEVSGSVRVISKSTSKIRKTENRGITQALDKDGTPLCVQCFKPYKNSLLNHSDIVCEENAWQTRFCTEKCAHNYWLVTNNEYMRGKVYEIEHGICQMCQFDANALFRQIRDTQDQKKRAELLTKSKFNSLATSTKQQIVKKPVAGQFWHVDHIIPVWEGGGQCDLDNLRTLCVLCHHKVTAKQASKRATAKKLETSVRSHDITAFFKRY